MNAQLETLIDYEFTVLPADVVLAYLDKRMPELDAQGREPFHPKHCGPCWFCNFKNEQKVSSCSGEREQGKVERPEPAPEILGTRGIPLNQEIMPGVREIDYEEFMNGDL